MKKTIYILFCILFMLQAEIIDRIAAIVGDEIILESEVNQLVEHQRYLLPTVTDEVKLKEMMLEELISNKILYDIALKDTNITVQDEEVERILDLRINSVLEKVGGEQKLEQMYNTSVSKLKKEYRTEIRKTLFVDKLKNTKLQKVDVNRNEIQEFYDTYKDSIPEVQAAIVLSQIVIKSSDESIGLRKAGERLKKIRSEIISNKITFEEAAEKYSQDPASAKNGGELGITSRGDLVPEYEIVAYNLKEGEISDPVKTQFGFHLIRMNKKIGEKINTSHILINAESEVSVDEDALAQAQTVKDSILNKYMTFEEAVRKHSSDTKSRMSDGRIGKINLDDLDEKYKSIFANSSIGYISDPLKQSDGYYLYKVLDKESAHKVNIDTDYSMLKNMTLERKKQSVLKKWIDELRKKVYIELK